MKRTLALFLAFAMLLPMLSGIPVTRASEAEQDVQEKPYYLVNWGGVDADDIDNVYGLVTMDSPNTAGEDGYLTVNAGGSSDIAQIAKYVREAMEDRPEGTRYILFMAPQTIFPEAADNVVYLDRGFGYMRDWMDEFLQEYKRIGGDLDGIITDMEYFDALSYYLNVWYYNPTDPAITADTTVFKRIVEDPRYATEIRPLLEERGFKFYQTTDAYKTEIYSIYLNAGSDYSVSRRIWDVVMRNRLNQYLTDYLYKTLVKYYPDGELNDYQSQASYAWLKETAVDGAPIYLGGNYVQAGTSSNTNFYAHRPDATYFTNLANQPAGFNGAYFAETAFNKALYEFNTFKNMYLASGKISAWTAFYDYGCYDDEGNPREVVKVSNTPYYTETLFHMGMLDPEPMIGFIVPSSTGIVNGMYAGNGEDYLQRVRVVEQIMDELTRLVGYADREPIVVPTSWNDGYLLSGMYAGGKNIWRITPDTDKVSVTSFKVDGADPTFSVNGKTITFPGGKIITDGEISEVGTCGYWIETDRTVEPVITYSTTRFEDYPSLLEDFDGYAAGTALSADTAIPEDAWKATGSAVIKESAGGNQVLALNATSSATSTNLPKYITAGDSYAKKQAWEITVTVPNTSASIVLFAASTSDGGIKIANGKVYYDNGSSYTELSGVEIAAGGKYTFRREVDFSVSGAYKSSYAVYDAQGTLLGEVKNVAMRTITLPVSNIKFSVTSSAEVLLDNYKIYPTCMAEDVEIYNAESGIMLQTLTGAETASQLQGTDVAYRFSWMNATTTQKNAAVWAVHYDASGNEVSREIVDLLKMVPGGDGVATGVVEKKSASVSIFYSYNTEGIYSVTVYDGTTDKAWAKVGEKVKVISDAAPAGKAFNKWTVCAGSADITFANASHKATTFTMPEGDVIVMPAWYGSYGIEVVGGTADKAVAFEGDTVTLTATPVAGMVFNGWTANEGSVAVKFANSSAATTTFTMPAGKVSVTANWTLAPEDVLPTIGQIDDRFSAAFGVTLGDVDGSLAVYYNNATEAGIANAKLYTQTVLSSRDPALLHRVSVDINGLTAYMENVAYISEAGIADAKAAVEEYLSAIGTNTAVPSIEAFEIYFPALFSNDAAGSIRSTPIKNRYGAEVYNTIVNDARYATEIRPLLVERNFPFYTGDDNSELYSIATDSNASAIWDEVSQLRLSKYVYEIFYEALQEYYPDAMVNCLPTITTTAGVAVSSVAGLFEIVTINAGEAPDGKTFDKWVLMDGSAAVTIADVNSPVTTIKTLGMYWDSEVGSFVFPAGNVGIYPTWRDYVPYSINVVGGTADVAIAESGDTITLTATPVAGLTFNGWTVNDGSAAVEFVDASATTTTFVMPAGNVSVAANWTVGQIDDRFSAALGLSMGNVNGSLAVYYNAATDAGIANAKLYSQTVLSSRDPALLHRVSIDISGLTAYMENVAYISDAGIAGAKAAAEAYLTAIKANASVPSIEAFEIYFPGLFDKDALGSIRSTPIKSRYGATVYNTIVNDARYATEIRPLLVERNFPFYTGSDNSELYSIATNSTASTIWDEVSQLRLSKYVYEIFYEALQETYPDAMVNCLPVITVGEGNKIVAGLNETVTINAGEAPAGKVFDRWALADGSTAVTVADMYSASTTVKTLGMYWDATAGSFKFPAGNVGLIPVWKDYVTYGISVSGGTADKVTAMSNETVTLTATPVAGMTFNGWTVEEGSAAVTFADASAATTTFTMPEGNVSIKANWTVVQMDDNAFSAALGLSLGKVNGNWAVYYGSATDAGIANAKTYAQSVLSSRPADKLHRISLTVAALAAEDAVYLTDADVAAAKAAVDTYFAAIKANAGVPFIAGVDINFDSMFGTSSGSSMRAAYLVYWHEQKGETDIYQRIVADERYATEIRPLLAERGFRFMEWTEGSTKTEISVITNNEWSGYGPTQADVEANRTIWDTVMKIRLCNYMAEIIGEPLQQYYPGAMVNCMPTIAVTEGVTVDKSVAAPGEIVTVIANGVPEGVAVNWITADGSAVVEFTVVNDTTATFVMPAGNVGIMAAWNNNVSYSVNVSGGSANKTEAVPGETVTLNAVALPGMSFNGWTVGEGSAAVEFADASAATTTFRMPEGNVVIKANWKIMQIDDVCSAALGLNLGTVNGNWAVYYGSANDTGIGYAKTYAQSVLAGRPKDQLYRLGMNVSALPAENVVFLTDEGIAAAKAGLETYLAAIKANTAVPFISAIDVTFDSMLATSSGYSMRAAYLAYWHYNQGETDIYQRIVADERYQTEIRPMLEERGFHFMQWPEGSPKTELAAITATEWSGYGITSAEAAAQQAIWDEVMKIRLSKYMYEIFNESLQKYYPGAMLNCMPTVAADAGITVKSAAAPGEIVTVTANNAPVGMVASWSTMDGSAAVEFTALDVKTATFVMPAGNVGITFTWVPCEHRYVDDDGDCTTAHVCAECQMEVIPAKEHTGGTATCKDLAKCENCGKAYGDYAEHVFAGNMCIVCGEDAEGCEHNYEAVVTDPTCDEAGYTTYTCTNCGDSYTETIPATGHNYEAVVTPPTSTAIGYTTHTCVNCGDSYVDSYVSATSVVAQIEGGLGYATLTEAIANAPAGATIKLMKNVNTDGFVIDKSLTIDFNGFIYRCRTTVADGVAVQILDTAGAVTLKGGRLEAYVSDAAKFEVLIQNYADLTLESMTLNATNLQKNAATTGYACVLSNYSGTVLISNTNITAPSLANAVALDTRKVDGYEAADVTVGTGSYLNKGVEVSGGKVTFNIEFKRGLIYNSGIVAKAADVVVTIPDGYCFTAEGIMTAHSYKSVVTKPTNYDKGYTTHTCVNCGDSYVDSYVDQNIIVAEVNGVKYSTMNDALRAAPEGATVKLLQNVIGDGWYISKSVTIDFGGHRYTVTTKRSANAIWIAKGTGSVTLKNGTIQAGSNIADAIAFLIANYGDNLTIEGMTLYGYELKLNDGGSGYSCVVSNYNGNITINGTTIRTNKTDLTRAYAIGLRNGGDGCTDPKVTVGTDCNIVGMVEVQCGEIYLGSSTSRAIHYKSGTITKAPNALVYGAYGYCFNADNVMMPHEYTYTVVAPTVYEKGYTLNTCIHCGYNYKTNKVAPLVAIAQVGTEKYATMEEAIAAAGDNGVVTMLKSVTGPGFTVNKNVTIDFNGFNMNFNATVDGTSAAIVIAEGKTVTLKSSAKNSVLQIYSTQANLFDTMIVNNGTLTLENMTLKGANLDKNVGTDNVVSYLVFNNGEVVLGDAVTLTVNNNGGEKAYGVYDNK